MNVYYRLTHRSGAASKYSPAGKDGIRYSVPDNKVSSEGGE